MVRFAVGAMLALVVAAAPSFAQQLNITKDKANASFVIKGKPITITRNQTPDAPLPPDFSQSSALCPPSCVTAMEAAPGVSTVGELEVIAFLEHEVASGQGLLLDSRSPDWFARGSIPGALNVPAETLTDKNPYRDEILRALGGVKTGATWDFINAPPLMIFCSGPRCDQSPRAIRALINTGYPAHKIRYYRGGMLVWSSLGLTITPNMN
ncbi:Rhodanese-related sulfurtransferase [Aliiroseovarius crassostreae]|uniref:Sulfurtransferase n=1 Tax=Aliiroseovarius crassostreae TaxID=154981 RepID=A0A0P7J8G0_9RHOB|nr:rhodanese-like domain-containing protein [Aliiroseovarius crassostreae]KPN64920.1 sulfurtransferase [Aliiroseovarius crassostreae]SFU61509.1 Rhodanese-related sulfurtransferase [Aliiroseovarius crassostreae]